MRCVTPRAVAAVGGDPDDGDGGWTGVVWPGLDWTGLGVAECFWVWLGVS